MMSSFCETDVQAQLIALYTKLADNPDTEFGWSKGKTNARQLGYCETWLEQLHDAVWESETRGQVFLCHIPIHCL